MTIPELLIKLENKGFKSNEFSYTVNKIGNVKFVYEGVKAKENETLSIEWKRETWFDTDKEVKELRFVYNKSIQTTVKHEKLTRALTETKSDIYNITNVEMSEAFDSMCRILFQDDAKV